MKFVCKTKYLQITKINAFSLVEMIVVIGIMAVIGVAVASFLERQNKQTSLLAAKEAAQTDIQTIFQRIEKDFVARRTNTDYSFNGSLSNGWYKSISITKLDIDTNFSQSSYTVTYTTNCVNKPSSLTKYTAPAYTCAGCNSNQIPRVTITSTKSGAPTFIIPTVLSNSSTHKAVNQTSIYNELCFRNSPTSGTPTHVSIKDTAAWINADTVKVLTGNRETLIPLENKSTGISIVE